MCVCIHSAIRCFSARLPYRPHIRPHPPVQLLRHPSKHPIENLVGEVNRLLNGLARGHGPHVDLPFPRQPDTGNEARAWYTVPRLSFGMCASGSNITCLRPAAGGDELVRSPEEDLRGQVPAQLPAEGTPDRDGFEGEFPDAGWDIAPAPFAGDD